MSVRTVVTAHVNKSQHSIRYHLLDDLCPDGIPVNHKGFSRGCRLASIHLSFYTALLSLNSVSSYNLHMACTLTWRQIRCPKYDWKEMKARAFVPKEELL